MDQSLIFLPNWVQNTILPLKYNMVSSCIFNVRLLPLKLIKNFFKWSPLKPKQIPFGSRPWHLVHQPMDERHLNIKYIN